MKRISYPFNIGTENRPAIMEKTITCEPAAYEEVYAIALQECYEGEPTVEDIPDTEEQTTAEEQLAEMAAAIERGLTT